ncbi:ras-2 protein [Apiospora phragmitis]|uniref:Ras-2 protein n=1 Tax=Apiospora phragmitis TaxID=2905665 RepID=A0ABR1SVL6_9PEZI
MSLHMPLYQLVMLGEERVGKTALATRFLSQQFFETYDPTIEDSYRKQVMIDGHACITGLLDTAGQNEYTVLLLHAGRLFSIIRDLHAEIQKTRTHPIPILLIGNNRDLESGREVSIHEGRALAQELRCGFIETSARDDDNVEKVFFTMVGILRRQAVAAAEQQGSKNGTENFCAEEQVKSFWNYFRNWTSRVKEDSPPEVLSCGSPF